MFGVRRTLIFFERHGCISKKLLFGIPRVANVIGLIFFVAVNAEAYHDIIQQFNALLHKDECHAIFQQALSNAVKDMMSILAEFLGKQICKLSSHSPDLSPWTFFYRVISRILFVRLLLAVLQSSRKKLRM